MTKPGTAMDVERADRNVRILWNSDSQELVLECSVHGRVQMVDAPDLGIAIGEAASHLAREHDPPFGWQISVEDGRLVRFTRDPERVKVKTLETAVLFDGETDDIGTVQCAISFDALEYFGFRLQGDAERTAKEALAVFHRRRVDIEAIAREKILRGDFDEDGNIAIRESDVRHIDDWSGERKEIRVIRSREGRSERN